MKWTRDSKKWQLVKENWTGFAVSSALFPTDDNKFCSLNKDHRMWWPIQENKKKLVGTRQARRLWTEYRKCFIQHWMNTKLLVDVSCCDIEQPGALYNSRHNDAISSATMATLMTGSSSTHSLPDSVEQEVVTSYDHNQISGALVPPPLPMSCPSLLQ